MEQQMITTPPKLFLAAICSGMLMLMLGYSANGLAASINLNPLANQYPDIYSVNTLNYDYTASTCYNSSQTATGSCGTGGQYRFSYGVATGSGVFTVAGTPLNIDMEAGGPAPLSITGTPNYSLMANFTTTAGVTSLSSGSISVTGTVSGFSNTTILSGTLGPTPGYPNPFGFGGYNGTGLFEFTFNLTGGEMYDRGALYGGVILTASSLCNGLLGSGSYTGSVCNSLFSGNWDSSTNPVMMNKDFSANQNTSANTFASANTFVPVPAAVWLLGSGLVALMGFARRRLS